MNRSRTNIRSRKIRIKLTSNRYRLLQEVALSRLINLCTETRVIGGGFLGRSHGREGTQSTKSLQLNARKSSTINRSKKIIERGRRIRLPPNQYQYLESGRVRNGSRGDGSESRREAEIRRERCRDCCHEQLWLYSIWILLRLDISSDGEMEIYGLHVDVMGFQISGPRAKVVGHKR